MLQNLLHGHLLQNYKIALAKKNFNNLDWKFFRRQYSDCSKNSPDYWFLSVLFSNIHFLLLLLQSTFVCYVCSNTYIIIDTYLCTRPETASIDCPQIVRQMHWLSPGGRQMHWLSSDCSSPWIHHFICSKRYFYFL